MSNGTQDAHSNHVIGDFSHVRKNNGELEKKYNTLVSDKHHYTENVNKIIVLRNLYGRLGTKAKLKPTKSKATGEIMGVLQLTPEESQKMQYNVTTKNYVEAMDGYTFNLNSTIERLNWNWVQYSELIAPNRLAGQSSPMAQFYIEDIENENMQNGLMAEKRYQAEKMIREEWTAPHRIDMARLLGQDMRYSSQLEVLDYLVGLARKDSAEKILELKKDPYHRDRLLMLRFMDANIIEQKNGALYYGDMRLGLDEESVLQFMIRTENRDIVDIMRELFNSKYSPDQNQYPNVPVRGQSRLPDSGMFPERRDSQSFSSSVTPTPVAAPPVKTFTIEQLQLVAPNTYARIFGRLNEMQIEFMRENYTSDQLRELARQEIQASLGSPAVTVPEDPRLATLPEVAPATADTFAPQGFMARRQAQPGTLQEGEEAPVHETFPTSASTTEELVVGAALSDELDPMGGEGDGNSGLTDDEDSLLGNEQLTADTTEALKGQQVVGTESAPKPASGTVPRRRKAAAPQTPN